jgi:glycosyltransferase involved in cell wall biosynthesis
VSGVRDRRLLAVSWEMPPLSGPRALQVSRTLATLGSVGWSSTVVCVDPRPGGPLRRDAADNGSFSAPGVALERVASPEESALWRAAFRLVPPLGQLPDRQRVWAGRAFRAASRRLRREPCDLIVSFAQPWSDHLVGLRLHRASRLPWVAHFSDPWVDSPYLDGPAWLRARWRRMEAAVVAGAGALVFTTEQTAAAVMRKYPDAWRRKAHVVPHGYDRSELARVVPAPRTSEPRLRLVYAGRFYDRLRTPGPLLGAIAALRSRGALGVELELLLVGPGMAACVEQVRRLGLESVVTIAGRKPYLEALGYAATADVLVVIDAPGPTPSLFLPSKLVDYLMLRKPILGLTPREGASADLLRQAGCPLAEPGDVEAIAAALEGLLEAWRGGGLRVAESFDAVAARFDIARTTARLAEILDACL